jgi:hypothetical protein
METVTKHDDQPIVSIKADLAVILWKALFECSRPEAKFLAAAMIDEKICIEGTEEEILHYWKDYLIDSGYITESGNPKLSIN